MFKTTKSRIAHALEETMKVKKIKPKQRLEVS